VHDTFQSYLSQPFFKPLGTRVSNEEVLAHLRGKIDPALALGYMTAAGSAFRYLDYEPVSIPETAAEAVQGVLELSGLDLEDLDGLIYTSLFRDNYEPSTAAFVANELGSPHLKTLDVTTACSGMAHAVEVATGWLAANPSLERIALVSVDKPFRILDFEIDSEEELVTKGSGLTVGAATSALIVSRGRPEVGIGLRQFVSHDDASYASICKVPIGGYFSSDSNRLAKPTVVSLMKVKEAAGGLDENTWVLPHQPSVHVERFARILHLKRDRVIITHPEYGNTVCSAWVSAYHHLFTTRFDEVAPHDPVLIKTMAGGFSSLGILGNFVKARGFN